MNQHDNNLSTKEQENLYRYHLGVQGFCDSYAQGEKHRAQAIALKMLDRGYKLDEVADVTDLPVSETERIKDDPSWNIKSLWG